MLDTTTSSNQIAGSTALIEFNNVDFSIGKQKFIHGLSCKLAPAGKTVVMGANGAGKSLFLRLLAGLLKPDRGQIRVGSSNDEVSIAIVFQKPVLLRRSAFANVAYVLKKAEPGDQDIAATVNKALALARLEGQAQTPARSLSGGEQQRLALARALVAKPDVILLDEATANLDPASTFIVEKMVDEVSGNGTKIVFVTHDVKQTKRVADDILFIHKGRILSHKRAKDFFRDPGDIEAQAYLDGRITI